MAHLLKLYLVVTGIGAPGPAGRELRQARQPLRHDRAVPRQSAQASGEFEGGSGLRSQFLV